MAKVRVCRSPLTLEELRISAGRVEDTQKSCGEKCLGCFKCDSSPKCVKKSILSSLPFIDTLRTYKLKYIFSDMIAGLSVAIVHIPQGMAVSLLASLPAVYGLYSSFWPPLFYFFFGSSPHNSLGTMAIISLLVAAAVDREVALVSGCGPVIPPTHDVTTVSAIIDISMTTTLNVNITNNPLSSEDSVMNHCDFEKVRIAMTLCLLSGVIQLGMCFLGLGIVTILMPASFVSGFTTAAAFQITTSLLKLLLGIRLTKRDSLFRVPLTWVDVCRNLLDTNIPTLVISIITIFILIVLKEGINKRFANKMFMPVPSELIVVVIGTLCSYLANFEKNYDVNIIGDIPRGVPVPLVPPMHYAGSLITDAIVIAILSFVISFSMADLFARKHRYAVDSSQELLAYGIMHTGSAFFHCFPGAAAPPRSV